MSLPAAASPITLRTPAITRHWLLILFLLGFTLGECWKALRLSLSDGTSLTLDRYESPRSLFVTIAKFCLRRCRGSIVGAIAGGWFCGRLLRKSALGHRAWSSLRQHCEREGRAHVKVLSRTEPVNFVTTDHSAIASTPRESLSPARGQVKTKAPGLVVDGQKLGLESPGAWTSLLSLRLNSRSRQKESGLVCK
jgi:hypothetical protein